MAWPITRLDQLSERLSDQLYLVGDTIDFTHVKRHYYEVRRDIKPSGVVPAHPALSG